MGLNADDKYSIEKIDEVVTTYGFILMSDPVLPSVASLVAQEPINGSWWGHPQGKLIFNVANALEDDHSLMSIKLICGKVTFVHRKLWAEVVSIAAAKEEWQTDGLSDDCLKLINLVEARGQIKTNDLKKRTPEVVSSAVIRESENRLLIYSKSFHSDSGAHYKELSSWKDFCRSKKIAGPLGPTTAAKSHLEGLLLKMCQDYGADGWLPWKLKASKSKRDARRRSAE